MKKSAAVILTSLIASAFAHGEGEGGPVDPAVEKGRIALIVLIAPVTLLASAMPWILHKTMQKRIVDFLGIGSCLSAGVVLGAAFSHVLPEVMETFPEYFELVAPDYPHKDYPFAPLIAMITFFALVLIDKLVVDTLVHKGHSHTETQENASKVKAADGTAGLAQPDTELVHQSSSTEQHQHSSTGQNHVVDALETFSSMNTDDGNRIKKLGTAYIFLIALSMHSVFDGLAISSATDIEGFYGLMVAVVIHKIFDGFALGVPIYFAKFTKLQSCLALTFCAMMTPLGIGVGWATTEQLEGPRAIMARGFFLSMSLGSFVYIGLMELLPAGLSNRKMLGWKLAALIGGWGILALLALWV